MTRADLIARVESAPRPTQSLFVEVFKVQFGADPEEPGVGKQYRLFVYSGAYLDAAMMLVPEGWFTSDFHQGPSGGNWWELSRIGDGDQWYATVKGIAATPALALAAAAIRAGGV
jgi:hypothetical protein